MSWFKRFIEGIMESREIAARAIVARQLVDRGMVDEARELMSNWKPQK